MRLVDVIVANLRRRAGKAVFLFLIVVFGVSAVTAMVEVSRAMRAEIGDTFDQIGANIVILPGEARRFGYGGVALPAPPAGMPGAVPGTSDTDLAATVYLPESVTATVLTIKNDENIAIVAPKLLAAVEGPDGAALAVGVRFPAELRLRQWWGIGASAAPAPEQVLLGADLAARWGMAAGWTLTLEGHPFTVAGVLPRLGSEEDRAVWMDLGTLQGLTGAAGQVSFIELAALCNTCPIDEIVHQLTEVLPGARITAIKTAVEARQAVVDRFAVFTQALSLTILALVAVAVGLMTLGSVRERTREIGILRALGCRRRHILAMVYLESGLVGLAGAALGSFAGGLGAAGWPGLGPSFVLGATGLAVLVVLAAATLPAWQASRIDPVRALRMI